MYCIVRLSVIDIRCLVSIGFIGFIGFIVAVRFMDPYHGMIITHSPSRAYTPYIRLWSFIDPYHGIIITLMKFSQQVLVSVSVSCFCFAVSVLFPMLHVACVFLFPVSFFYDEATVFVFCWICMIEKNDMHFFTSIKHARNHNSTPKAGFSKAESAESTSIPTELFPKKKVKETNKIKQQSRDGHLSEQKQKQKQKQNTWTH